MYFLCQTFARKSTNIFYNTCDCCSLQFKFFILGECMLKELTKIANKLDGLGLTKEADLLDKVISKMAGIGEGSPAYMSKGPGDSELEVNESGEFEYPEEKALKGTDHPSYGGKAKPEITPHAFSDFLSATTGCINDIFDMIEKAGYGPNTVMNLKEDIKSIAKELSENLSSNELDTEEDVMDSIESLITEMDESILGNWGHPNVKADPYCMFSDWEENYMAEKMAGVEISKYYRLEAMMGDAADEMDRWARVGINIEKIIEAFKPVKSEHAYVEFDEIQEILDPIMELADMAKEIYDGCKEDIQSKYETLVEEINEAIEESEKEPEMPSGEYELPPVAKGSDHPMGWDRLEQTSPEQAQFEEDQEPYGDADVVGEDWREDEDEGDWDDEDDEKEEAQHLTHRDGPEEEEGYRGNRGNTRITEVPSHRFR